MQTLQFTRTLDRIVNELTVTELLAVLHPIVVQAQATNFDESFRRRFSDLALKSYGSYQALIKEAEAGQILKSLGTERVYDTERIGKLIFAVNSFANSAQIRSNGEYFPLFSNFFEMLSWLSKISDACTNLLEKDKIGTIAPEDKVVEMELVDYDGSTSTIATFLTTMADLHSDLAQVLGQKSQLKVLYIDTGSAVRFGFEMAKSVADTLTKLALQVWDKVRYRRLEYFDREIGSLTKGLDFMDTLQQRVKGGAIGAEDGKLIGEKVVRNMRTIIGLGAMLPLEKGDERKLLAEAKEVKLLVSGTPDPPPDN